MQGTLGLSQTAPLQNVMPVGLFGKNNRKMCTRIRRFRDYAVTDRVKVRAHELNALDFFQHMGTIYRVTQVSDTRIHYMELTEYTYSYGFGKKSQQFVYKILLD